MYNKPYGFDKTDLNFDDVSNKLFCTFSELDEIDNLIDSIKSQYDVLYNKIFVLQIKSSNEYVCTYNIDYSNLNEIPENTILVHRKKETNTLYTINALNELIKKLNGGVVDVSYRINWMHYRNCILLTQHNELKQLNTKVYKIVEL
jgi:archaellum component FlaC